MLPTLLSSDRLAACFAADYAEAHVRFRQVCDRHEHSRYQEFVYRETGPDQEKLLTAVAWLGDSAAQQVLVLQSATHGVEGFAGAAIQIDYLTDLLQESIPAGLAILFVHALNPYGFAWLRRVNEQGVDLNRNFVDFEEALPANPGYAELAADLLSDPEQEQAAAQRLAAYRERHSQQAFEQAVSGGQYEFADGLFYGGRAPSQSRLYLEQIVDQFKLAQRQQVAVIDLHTGLGPFGYGELICDHPPGSAGVAWARRVYGQSVTEPALGSSSSVPKQGLIDYYWQASLAERVCFVTLEFGTYPLQQVFDALCRDQLLHRKPVQWHDPGVQQVKQFLRNTFYPATPDWQEMVLLRGRQVIRQAVQGLVEVD